MACSLYWLLLAAACASSPSVVSLQAARQVCVIQATGTPGLPRFYRRANASSLNLGPARLLCDAPLAGRPLADRCEAVDELDALLGTGKVYGPSGSEVQQVCPIYASDRLRLETPVPSTPVCSGGCDNRQLVVRERSGSVTRLVFYDDPACHAPADPACPGSERRCYYRVYSLTSELR